MFPVYTGINRLFSRSCFFSRYVPCIHRDKPRRKSYDLVTVGMFPVYTGINRLILHARPLGCDVPCIHRDKPKSRKMQLTLKHMFPVHTGIFLLCKILLIFVKKFQIMPMFQYKNIDN